MAIFFTRRALLASATALVLANAGGGWAVDKDQGAQAQFSQVEKRLNGRLGVYAIDTGSGAQLGYRADERFAFNSTFKVMLAGAILKRSEREAGLLERRIQYKRSNIVTHSPITEKHLKDGLTVAQLCEATIQTSDNTAANLLLRLLGGPTAVTAFARSIGDTQFRLDRWETALNSAIPGDLHDTSTPRSMGSNLKKLTLGDALGQKSRLQLQNWMRGSITGAERIRAGVPASWQVGDKTGGGDYGTANDIAVVWPPGRKPIIVTVYTSGRKKDSKARNDVVAAAARIVVEWAR